MLRRQSHPDDRDRLVCNVAGEFPVPRPYQGPPRHETQVGYHGANHASSSAAFPPVRKNYFRDVSQGGES
jgi:hypothetical protein